MPSFSLGCKKTWLFALGVAPLLAYIALSPAVAWPLYNAILLRPDKRVRDISEPLKELDRSFHVQKRDVAFSLENGTKIRGWFFEVPNTKRVFLVSYGCSGNMHRRLHLAHVLLSCGGSVFLYDYEGYGLSEGSPSISGACESGVAAYDYLVQKEMRQPDDIIAFGESFGTGVTGNLVRERKPGAAILHCGYSSLFRAGRDMFPWLNLYPENTFPKADLNNVAVFQEPHPPLLIVHGTRDRTVLYRNAEDLYKASTEPKVLVSIPDGEHGAFGPRDEFCAAVSNFLRNNQL